MLKILFCKDNNLLAKIIIDKKKKKKDNNLLAKIEIDSEFLILKSRLNQSFRVQVKNKYLKQPSLQF